MKNLQSRVLSLVLFITSYATMQAEIPYDAARTQFKERLASLIGRHDYVPSIEPHLEKAEAELAILQHLQTKPAFSDHDKRYMEQWAQCHVDIYNHVASRKNDFRLQKPELLNYYCVRCQMPLQDAIQAIKEQDNLSIDSVSEALKTTVLITAANTGFRTK